MGGTFDPIHLGHLEAAAGARDCAGLDLVLLVPAGVPPHRAGAVAPAGDRLAMCELAAREFHWLEVSPLELRRDGPSYTLETLRQLHAERPADELSLILGWDAARDLNSWHQPQAVLRLASLVVLRRPGLPAPDVDAFREAGLDPSQTRLCAAPTPDIRATEVRRLAAADRPLTGLVPDAVAGYIREHRLYGALGR